MTSLTIRDCFHPKHFVTLTPNTGDKKYAYTQITNKWILNSMTRCAVLNHAELTENVQNPAQVFQHFSNNLMQVARVNKLPPPFELLVQ